MQTGEVLHQEINEYLAEYDDAATLCAEILDGSMRTPFEFQFDGEELYGRDGRPLGPIFDDAIPAAKQEALKDPKMNFEVSRRETEKEENKMMYSMMRGELPNTIIVVSEFPEELRDETEDVGGYNVTRQQAMVRVITREPNGTLKIVSQTLDKSDREGLEAIYALFGEAPEEGSLLGQRIHRDLTPEQQKDMANRVTYAYDSKLAEKYGGEWYAGRQPKDETNTYDFVRAQSDLLDTFAQMAIRTGKVEESLYGLAAAMSSRFKNRNQEGRFIPSSEFHAKGDASLEMQLAAETAWRERRIFSGCGLTMTGDGFDENDMTSEEQLEELGYGGKSEVMKCVNCPECGTFHDEVKPKNGKYCCKNPDCGYTVKAS
jgi:hypothetical protein